MSAASYEMSVFCTVVDLGSFAAAAERLTLSPSAVSKIVSRTEDRLGVRLLSRTTRRLSLTSEGELYLERARDVLAAISEAESEVGQSSQNPSGILRINTGPTFGRYRLISALPDFLERYPDIEIQLDVTDRNVDLAADQVDVAVRTGALSDSRLVARQFMHAERVVCASPEYVERHGRPETPEALYGHRCLLISGISALADWPFETDDGIKRVRIRARSTSDSADVVRDMALCGMGVARLIRYTVEDELKSGKLIPLLEGVRSRERAPISAVMLPERRALPRVRAFVDFLVERFSNAG